MLFTKATLTSTLLLSLSFLLFVGCDSAPEKDQATKPKTEKKKKLLTGIRTSYYDEDEKIVMSEIEYKDGIRDGSAVDYYKNGKPRLVGGNLMGKKHGDFIYYHEDGRKYRKMSYDYGDLHGWDTLYYKSGRPKHAILYDDGEVQLGTVEWDARYKKVPLPKIKLREVNRMYTESKYFLFARFEEDIKDARFFISQLGNGTIEKPEYPFEPMMAMDDDPEMLYVVPIEPGYELAAKLVIRGRGVTKRGNPFVTHQVFPVVMR